MQDMSGTTLVVCVGLPCSHNYVTKTVNKQVEGNFTALLGIKTSCEALQYLYKVVKQESL